MKQNLTIPHGVLDGIEAFLRVAERRSFSAAAHDLGVSPSAISQTIKALEARIGVPLFTRTTRSVGLTQAGESFFVRAAPSYDGLADAYEAARNLAGRPAGRLRINLARGAIQPIFEPIISGFCAAYSDIELEIYAEEGLTDLSAGRFDAGIRPSELLDADMVAVRLSEPFRFCVAGTPAYFEKYGTPKTPDELRTHSCIRVRLAHDGLMPSWSFVDANKSFDVPVTGPLIVNDFQGLILGISSGVGLGKIPEPTVQSYVERGEMKLALEKYSTSSDGLFLYYPSRKQVMPKLRAFIDYLRQNLPDSRSR